MSEVNDQAVDACFESAGKAVGRAGSPAAERILADEAFLDRLAEKVADRLALRNGSSSASAHRAAAEAIHSLELPRQDR